MKNQWVRRSFCALALLAMTCSRAALALEMPKGQPLLTITGRIDLANVGKSAVFDAAMLEALPQHSYTVDTPWYRVPTKFTGPLLSDVLAAVKASGTRLRAVALNDYKTTIPVEDAIRYKVILARLINDRPLSVRDRGPLFVMYPFDTDRELRNSAYYDRCIWQLKSMEVE